MTVTLITPDRRNFTKYVRRRVRQRMIIASIPALGVTLPAHAQMSEAPGRNIAYIEVGGPGGLYSLDYERVLDGARSVRVGGTSWDFTTFDSQRERVRGVIAGLAYRYDVSAFFGPGEGRFIELGGAVIAGNYLRARYGVTEVSGAYASFSPQVGLRHQPSRGFMIRAMLTPMIPLVNRAAAYPGPGASMFAGVSIGYVFH